MASNLPLLLPQKALPQPPNVPHLEWQPKRYLSDPQPPPQDESKLQEETLANAKLLIDGKLIKKTRPRRTVDYNGGMGRWALLKRLRPSPGYVPYLRPAIPYIVDLLPPKAYPDNCSTSLCTKFIHTSTNKIRYPVNAVLWTPEGRRVLTGSTSGEFTLWNGLTFNFETILQAHDTAICAMTFNHSGAYLASSDKSGVIKYFEPNMNNLTAWQGSSSREAIRDISFSPDDQRFATASDDSSVRIWSFAESRVESVLTGHGWDVKCAQWHPTKGLIVSGSKDNLIKFWDPRTGTCLSTLHPHKNTIQALSWSPNGNLVASASRDQTVRVFDIRAMKEFRVLKGHKKEVCSIAWHPFHPILVSGGSEGSILHWDLSTPTPPTSFSTSPSPSTLTSLTAAASSPRATLSQAHDSNVWSLAYHPLGHLLVTASNDQTTRFWSRERPGEATSVEKPSDVVDLSGQDDDEDIFVPGFGAASSSSHTPFLGVGAGASASGSGGGYGRGWGGKDEDDSYHRQPSTTGTGMENGYGGRGNGGAHYDAPGGGDDFIPGFGASSEPPPRTGPPQQHYRDQETYGGGGSMQDEFGRDLPPGGPNGRDGRESRDPRDRDGRDSRDSEWGRGGGTNGHNRSGRWGPRRGRY
ncbi:WD40 repeat-like protein [Macrolepiota fuliginosa MF-IS2]|uniref:Polyadenylation factor subunit 2 n=1 Tax=Macrolepiota fuliginosa MF-IS2 TaxID=1400762 RepID=A0A9P6C9Z2_9AGAR|nr:WD40 repeat-like protein [Macrolepiota fuliginosa MF-IS2]